MSHRSDDVSGDSMALIAEVDTATAIYGAIGVAVAAVVGWFAKSFIALGDVFLRRAKEWAEGKKKHINSLEEKVLIYREIDTLVRLKSVERVLIFCGQNCGGIPSLNTPYNVGCTYGRSTDPTKRPDEDYRGPLRVDTAYLELLLRIIKEGCVTIDTDKMSEGSMLRQYYTTEGVTHARLYLLSMSPTKLRYMSVAKYSPGAFTFGDAGLIDMAVNRIRGLMETDPD